MSDLLSSIKKIVNEKRELPFSVYSSVHEQKLLNVPIVKPLLIVVLSGDKQLGSSEQITCKADNFIFLSDSPAINMRNIPKNQSYYALLIEFEYECFDGIPATSKEKPEYILGEVTYEIKQCLQQFVESAFWAPKSIWPLRKKEILTLFYHQGFESVYAMMGKPKLSHQIHDFFRDHAFSEMSLDHVCGYLAMSESTLRRKLKSEGTSLQEIKDRSKLGWGLHLLQTTDDSITLIADQCGYQSQSRFTERFKNHFGVTPSELRNTRLTDYGENMIEFGLKE